MEKAIESAATGVGNTISLLADHGVLFLIFGVLWIAFAVALVASQGTLNDAWHWVGSQHILVQAAIWLLFLPVMAGMWVWQTSWPAVLRLLLVASLAGWTLLIFPKPWK
jgi:hypothetical protein